jgi:nicotinamide riboside kinase
MDLLSLTEIKSSCFQNNFYRHIPVIDSISTKKDNVIKIAIVGPECTGKSTLSAGLAAHYNTLWVPEYARQYLSKINTAYQKHDLITIADGQLDAEANFSEQANNLIFCDTNLLVIKIWSQFKYKHVDSRILDLWNPKAYTHHLLTYIDVDWEFDPLRENPEQREELFKIYQEELVSQQIPFSIIKGKGASRLNHAIKIIDQILGEKY